MADDEALKALQAQIAELSASVVGLHTKKPVMLFGDYARAYLASKLLRASLRESTKTAFICHVEQHLLPRFGLLPLDKITAAVWLEWITEEKKLTKFFNARKSMMEILIAAKEDGQLERLPKLENPDIYEDVGRVLSDKEVERILWRCRRPFRLIFYVMWRMGCRPREILQWEWSMIDFGMEPADIAIPKRITKVDKARLIPLNEDVSRYLRARWLRGNGSPFVFPAANNPRRPELRDIPRCQHSYYAAWATACRRAKVENAMPYDLRRSYVTQRAGAGIPLLHLAQYLGTSVGMLEKIYAKRDAGALADVARGKQLVKASSS